MTMWTMKLKFFDFHEIHENLLIQFLNSFPQGIAYSQEGSEYYETWSIAGCQNDFSPFV